MSRKYKEIIILLFFLLTIFKLYIFTMLPVFKNNDSPETTTSAYTLGIGHPPGYPLFILVGKIFTLLPVASPGFRMNMFASFIAAIVLLLSFYLIKQNVHIVFDSKNNTIVYLSVFVLAFSCIFWNQAIEAKGGIYILNLLFFVILLYLCIKLLKGFNIKYLYLMSFIYGISLTNHWPSIIILLPIFGYFFLKYYYKLNSKNIYYTILFLILGISPYIYLPIRTGTNGIFIFMAKPDTWENFWWMIFRSGYTDMPAPSIDVYKYQIKEFFNIFFNNFSYLWILIFFGIYSIWKKNKEIFFIIFTNAGLLERNTIFK